MREAFSEEKAKLGAAADEARREAAVQKTLAEGWARDLRVAQVLRNHVWRSCVVLPGTKWLLLLSQCGECFCCCACFFVFHFRDWVHSMQFVARLPAHA